MKIAEKAVCHQIHTIVVGSGAAGLRAAERLHELGCTDIAVVTECHDFPLLIKALTESSIRGVWNMTQKDISLKIPVLNLPIGDIIMGLMCEIRHSEKGED